MPKKNFVLLTREGKENSYNPHIEKIDWIKILIRKDADIILEQISEEEIERIDLDFYNMLCRISEKTGKIRFENWEWRECLREAMKGYPRVCNAFMYAHEKENAQLFGRICDRMKEIVVDGDRSNGSVDSNLASSKRALIVDEVERTIYSNYQLTPAQRKALNDGYIYIHDMGHRRDTINCCLFDMENVLTDGFEMGDMWHEEPNTLNEAFDAIANISINAAAQIYGGFTIPQIDELLSKYAAKSYDYYYSEFKDLGVDKELASAKADENVERDYMRGFSALEVKFNSIISPRGDYPFITISFGLGMDKYSKMAVRCALEVRRKGHGKDFKKPVLFPKLVFLYDKNLHGEGKDLYDLFQAAIKCSSEVMYPEYLSLTGESGIVSEVYKRYNKVISPMCCRAFLTKWFERGGEEPADNEDTPVFIGRFNIGVVSLNLPMILAKSREDGEDFYKVLDYYLELTRQIHKETYRFLSEKKAHTNPLAFMQGGLYGGNLKSDDKIEPLLKSATASYGITALNELQRLYNKKSLVEDGEFALETMKYINKKISEFIAEDHIQYCVYGTPAESLCGKQVKYFKKKFGKIENVSDRDYFSNSFHCHVSEEISPIEKQDYEARFWNYVNGGKIQYIRIDYPKNIEAIETFVKRAMEIGFYEGLNISLAYCDNCGFHWNNTRNVRPEICPKCKKNEMTLIDRMCGYIAFSRLNGKSRLNDAKMSEIKDRICM